VSRKRAKPAASSRRRIKFDVAFTSVLKRAQRTLDLMLTELGQTTIPVFKDQALTNATMAISSG
jgi:2,3-bisphosphoglycerate-dependent phosphoglycerate mutase